MRTLIQIPAVSGLEQRGRGLKLLVYAALSYYIPAVSGEKHASNSVSMSAASKACQQLVSYYISYYIPAVSGELLASNSVSTACLCMHVCMHVCTCSQRREARLEQRVHSVDVFDKVVVLLLEAGETKGCDVVAKACQQLVKHVSS
jgi:hypothetical protein